MQQQDTKAQKEIIRSMVRSSYDLQKLRITIGNRVGANFRSKLGQPEPVVANAAEQEAVDKRILDDLIDDYENIMKSCGEVSPEQYNKMPTVRKFKPLGNITNYAELAIVKAYVDIYRNEESQFQSLKDILVGYPLYENFLSQVDGLGPQLSAVIISEIDWKACNYVSSLWKYAGVDVVRVAYYIDEKGVKQTIPGYEVDALFEDVEYDPTKPILKNGKFQVFFEEAGRSRKKDSLVMKTYTARDGTTSTRPGITFNPFLKTKLVGVLGTSFVRTGTKTVVDGKRMGSDLRKRLAKKEGYTGSDQSKEAVDAYLRSKGHVIEVVRTKYAKVYFDYRNRLDRSPQHDAKSQLHKHNMAVRYTVKRFLADLYVAGRTSEGLPVAEEYAVAKLGIVHGEVSPGKIADQRQFAH